MSITVRVIGKKDCHRCTDYRKVLDNMKYPYEFYDADTGDDKYMDAYMIDDMPVVQLLRDGKPIDQFLPGPVSTVRINKLIAEWEKKK